VVLLMWIYFSSGVLLFSASCAKAAQETWKRNTGQHLEEQPPLRPNGFPHLRAVSGTRVASSRPVRRDARYR